MNDVPAQPKRRRFQFSLLTLIVAVNVAGVLVWANVEVRRHKGILGITDARGWPLTACTDIADISYKTMYYAGGPWVYHSGKFGKMEGPCWRRAGVAWNIIIGLLLVAAASGLTELLVRKFRKAKRHDG